MRLSINGQVLFDSKNCLVDDLWELTPFSMVDTLDASQYERGFKLERDLSTSIYMFLGLD